MKLLYKFLSLCLCLGMFSSPDKSYATIHIVQVGLSGGLSFSPSGFSMPLGDTVRFQWVSGSHTTTSTSVPGGGVAWNQNITSGTTTYTYKPAVVGTYNYRCIPHVAMGMVGSFTVTTPLPIKFVSFMVSPTYRGACWNGRLLRTMVIIMIILKLNTVPMVSDFTMINQVKALPKAEGNYQYTDEKWKSSMNYYRLKAVDKNNTSEYSTVISIIITLLPTSMYI